MEANQKNFKQCDICKYEEAKILCPQCFSYYCDECFKPAHKNKNNSHHKTENVDAFVPIDTRCPEHSNVPINLFCIDEKGKNIYIKL